MPKSMDLVSRHSELLQRPEQLRERRRRTRGAVCFLRGTHLSVIRRKDAGVDVLHRSTLCWVRPNGRASTLAITLTLVSSAGNRQRIDRANDGPRRIRRPATDPASKTRSRLLFSVAGERLAGKRSA